MKKKILILIVCGGLIINVLAPAGMALAVGWNDEGLTMVGGVDEFNDDETVFNDGGIDDGVVVSDGGETSDLGDEEADEISDEEDVSVELPALYIKAVNPGYKIEGINNVGEMIEIARTDSSDAPISLAGLAVGYTNSSGNYSLLAEFSEFSWMTGESILLRLASSPGSELANLMYTKTLAMNAAISLTLNDEVIDEACWTGRDECVEPFNSTSPTTLIRNTESGEFEHVFSYQPSYNQTNYWVEEVKEDNEEEMKKATPRCRDIQFSELLSYYEASQTEQFVEFYNHGAETVILNGCQLKYKNKKYDLSGSVNPEGYYVYYPKDFRLTKNPTSSNKLEIIDADGAVVDALEYPNGQRKGTAYAMIGYDDVGKEVWKTTYAPTPGEPNNYQVFKTCEAGKVINEVTGNCVKVATVKDKVCKNGYYLNILTGRCKKIITKQAKTCKEGYYLNPETNRCRKIKNNDGANYDLTPEQYEEKSSFVALYAVLGVLGVGGIYLIYEFRKEIVKFWKRLWRKG